MRTKLLSLYIGVALFCQSCSLINGYNAFLFVKTITLAGQALVILSEDPSVQLIIQKLDNFFRNATDATPQQTTIQPLASNPLVGRSIRDFDYLVESQDGKTTMTLYIPKEQVLFHRTDPSSPTWEMKLESKVMVEERLLLASLQLALAEYGYYRGNIDGICGKSTERAIRKFQKDHSIQPTYGLYSCRIPIDSQTKEQILQK